MKRVLVVGSGVSALGRAIANALCELSVEAIEAADHGVTYSIRQSDSEYPIERTEYYKKYMREQANYDQAGIQQRRKALAQFHKEKRARMARKQAKKRRSRFV